jgi:uncharacterized protein (TIGR02265 family)
MHAGARAGQKPGTIPFVVASEHRNVPLTDTWDDFAARVEAAPGWAEIRGMFLREVLRLEPRVPSPRPNYVAFSLYPVREYMQLLLDTARIKYPDKTPANALLELGLGVYSLFARSMSGIAIFSVAGSNFSRICELSSKAYSITLKPGDARLAESQPGYALVQLRDVWPFPESFHCGVWLGAMQACNVRGTIEVSRIGPSDVDFGIKWQKSSV